MNNYATMIYEGAIPSVNRSEAAKYFKMAADKGNKEAMSNYATIKYKGEIVPADKKEAAKYLKWQLIMVTKIH